LAQKGNITGDTRGSTRTGYRKKGGTNMKIVNMDLEKNNVSEKKELNGGKEDIKAFPYY
jgi:hypothetical protein